MLNRIMYVSKSLWGIYYYSHYSHNNNKLAVKELAVKNHVKNV